MQSGYRRDPGGVEPNAIVRPIRSTPAGVPFPPRRHRGFHARLFTLKHFRLQIGSTHDRQETEMRPTERVAGSYGLAGNGGRELSRGSHVGFENVFFHQSHLAPSAWVLYPSWHLTRPSHHCCNPRVPWAGSLNWIVMRFPRHLSPSKRQKPKEPTLWTQQK